MPDFAIVDAHLHVYDPADVSYPWMQEVPLLNEPHLPARFFASTGAVQVEAAVFVEVNAGAGQHLLEAQTVGRYADAEPRLGALVVSMPLESPDDPDASLEALRAQPRVRGIRRLIQEHVDEPGWCLQPAFVGNVQRLSDFDLSFDLCVRHQQLPDIITLVERCPNIRFVLDHIGKPDIRSGLKQPWQAQLATLAQAPNVHCKLSGVVTEADHLQWQDSQVMPYIEHAINCFGMQRVMFGGDWPVARLATDYERWTGVVDRVLSGVPVVEQRQVYRDNANAFYRLGLTTDEEGA